LGLINASKAFLVRIPASEVAEIFTSEIVESGLGFISGAGAACSTNTLGTSMGTGAAATALGSVTSISATFPLR
jgi:hypothetical protein